MFIGVIAVSQGCCQSVLQRFIGVIAVSQGCCQAVLQSSIVQWRMHFAKNSAAVHWFRIIADLYEQQIIIGVNAVS